MAWDWITTEMFTERLEQIVNRNPASALLSIGDVYCEISEHCNNQVLEELAEEHERCTNCGEALDVHGNCSAC